MRRTWLEKLVGLTCGFGALCFVACNTGQVGIEGAAPGGGSPAECVADGDCPEATSDCLSRTCAEGTCGVSPVERGEACTTAGGKVCDGDGACVACLSNDDCAEGVCFDKVCLPSDCVDGVKNGAESDVDCGGDACLPCDNEKTCNQTDDCKSKWCKDGVCAPCQSDNDCTALESSVCNDGVCEGKKALGQSCKADTDCESGFCPADDGVCCDTSCEGLCSSCRKSDTGQEDGTCGAVKAGLDPKGECPASSGSCEAEACSGTTGQCAALPLGAVCRSAAGACDTLESCDGTSVLCPADVKVAMGTVCRASVGDCDSEEACDGVADNCPADSKFDSSTTCRAAAGACDAPETCDGVVDNCPVDQKIAANTVCRNSAGVCDVTEVCDGTSDACPADSKQPANVECRVKGGACDVAESCDGMNNDCPTDDKVAMGTECRAAAGACDEAEACDGVANACPADVFIADGQASTSDSCAPYVCDGAMAGCPTACANNADCIPGGTCTNMVCTAASGTTCREVLQLNPNAASGMYLIDPDGFGGNPPFSVYCDMVKDGGGWTNIDFSNNKVLLDNGHFVLCQGGMSTGANSVTCTNPVFDQDQNKPLYHFNCSGTDNSANYIIDHMAIKLGHKNNPSLGFSGLSQAYTNQTSSNDKEYCYINGTVVLWSNALCNAYNSPGNGNCRPGYFTISF